MCRSAIIIIKWQHVCCTCKPRTRQFSYSIFFFKSLTIFKSVNNSSHLFLVAWLSIVTENIQHNWFIEKAIACYKHGKGMLWLDNINPCSCCVYNTIIFVPWCNSPYWATASSLSGLHGHTHTPQSVGLLWTSDRPVAKTSTWQHQTLTRHNFHATGGIRTSSSTKWAATRATP